MPVRTSVIVAIAIVLIIVASVGSYFAGLAAAPVKTVTVTYTVTVTPAPTLTPTPTPMPTPTPTPAPAVECTEIKIGMPIPLTGVIAAFGEPDPAIATWFEDFVNTKLGGIYIKECGRKLPIRIIIRDTRSDETATAEVTADLITREKVHVIAAMHTPLQLPAVMQCEKYGVPCITTEAPMWVWLSGAPYKWSVHAFWTEFDTAHMFVRYFEKLVAMGKLDKTKPAAVFAESIEEPFYKAYKAMLTEYGWKIQDYGLVPTGTRDFSAIILDAKARGIEAAMINLPPPDFQAFISQAHELGWNIKALAVAKALLFPATAEAVGVYSYGAVTEVWTWPWANLTSELTGMTSLDVAKLYESITGKQWATPAIYTFVTLELVIHALQKAQSLDPKAIIDAAKTLCPVKTVAGTVCFGPKDPEKYFRELYGDELGPKMYEIYKKYAPEIIQNLDIISIQPEVLGQWVKGTKWSHELMLIDAYNTPGLKPYEKTPLTYEEAQKLFG
jgi:branched-chain amino acid transport system substrate-binding protein